jgi:hypothetical protein
MSTSPTSKPASPSSPEDGPATEPERQVAAASAESSNAGITQELPARAAAAAAELRRLREPIAGTGLGALPHSEAERRAPTPIEIELEVSRQRSIGWAVGGTVLGIVLITHLGTVGVWGGIALVVWGAVHAVLLARTFMRPVGAIVVADGQVSLPRGPYRGQPVVVKPSDVTAVYLLRKSVPWNTAAPVLVVELGGRAMLFPRDWFASEADQRHVVHALHRE